MAYEEMPKPEPKEVDEKNWMLLQQMMERAVLKGEPYGDERCDNCLRLARHEAAAEPAQPEPAAARSKGDARPATNGFALGELLRTRRHGTGRVVAVDAVGITLEFDNGEQRSFLPEFLRAARRAPRAAPARSAP